MVALLGAGVGTSAMSYLAQTGVWTKSMSLELEPLIWALLVLFPVRFLGNYLFKVSARNKYRYARAAPTEHFPLTGKDAMAQQGSTPSLRERTALDAMDGAPLVVGLALVRAAVSLWVINVAGDVLHQGSVPPRLPHQLTAGIAMVAAMWWATWLPAAWYGIAFAPFRVRHW
jgi:hypothetical protein